MKAEMVKVGCIDVDSGMCWVGDPCYILHKGDEANHIIGNNWEEFCSIISTDMKYGVASFKWNSGNDGFGVCVNTGWGDGTYPVYARYEDGVIAELSIKFDTSHQEEEDELNEWLDDEETPFD